MNRDISLMNNKNKNGPRTDPPWYTTGNINKAREFHYNDIIMGAIASQITSLTIVFSTVYSDADQTSKLRVTGLCVGNSPVTGEFPAQMASNAENVSIWWRHHALWQSTACLILSHRFYRTITEPDCIIHGNQVLDETSQYGVCWIYGCLHICETCIYLFWINLCQPV